MGIYHKPALLLQSIDGLNIKPEGIYVDATFGSGQSSLAILEKLGENGRLYSFDQDKDAQVNIFEDKRFTFIAVNFKYLGNFLKFHGVFHIDGLLADLGVSFHQFDVAERGFSTRYDGPLDMRMDQQKPFTAADIIASYSESDLSNLFYRYGEINNARKLANLIVKSRQHNKILTTSQLKSIILPCIPKQRENKYLAQVYQALRMEVNKEVEVLEALLTQSVDLLNPGGRLCIISYHSIEDRIVKQFMRSGNLEGRIEKDFFGNNLSPFILISHKAIVPDEEEQAANTRSRSAKLRICEKSMTCPTK